MVVQRGHLPPPFTMVHIWLFYQYWLMFLQVELWWALFCSYDSGHTQYLWNTSKLWSHYITTCVYSVCLGVKCLGWQWWSLPGSTSVSDIKSTEWLSSVIADL